MSNTCVLGETSFLGKYLKTKHPEWVYVSRETVDLTNQSAVDSFFRENQFDCVIHCCMKGGSRLKTEPLGYTHENLMMFENVVRHLHKSFNKLIYFSSGASQRGSPPTDPYGFSKWIIDHRIKQIEDAYSLRIWGCWGPNELPTRLRSTCLRDKHVVIQKDKYFDYIDVQDLYDVIIKYINNELNNKIINLVYEEKKLLSEWATYFGATYEIIDTSELDVPYVCTDERILKLRKTFISQDG